MRRWIAEHLAVLAGDRSECRRVGRRLQQYLDGYADSHDARQISAHLERCRRCGLDAATYTHIKATLAAGQQAVPVESLQRLREFGDRLAAGGHPPGALR